MAILLTLEASIKSPIERCLSKFPETFILITFSLSKNTAKKLLRLGAFFLSISICRFDVSCGEDALVKKLSPDFHCSVGQKTAT